MEQNKYLLTLKALLEKSDKALPIWLEDLLLFGPRFEQWPQPETRPNRQLLTEFLARWLKFAGISHEESLEWLQVYSRDVLASYSKSSLSHIRHSTKCNTRYVFKCGFSFDFEALARELPEGFEGRPVYMPLLQHWTTALQQAKQKRRDDFVPFVPEPFVPVKERFREQFEKALAFAREEDAKGEYWSAIVTHLNKKGFRTRTGRRWTLATLRQSIKAEPDPKSALPSGSDPAPHADSSPANASE